MIRLFFILLISYGVLFAQSELTIKNSGDSFKSFELEIYEDKTSSLTFEEIKKVKEFSPHSNAFSLGYTSSSYWFRFSVKNTSSSDLEYFVKFTENFLDELDCYVVSQNGEYNLYEKGINRYVSSKVNQHKRPEFKVTLQDGETKDIYIRVSSVFSLFNSIMVMDREVLSSYEMHYSKFYSLYFGIMIAMILYNLFLYLFTKDKTYIYYVLYIFSFMLVQMKYVGYTPFDTYTSVKAYYSINFFSHLTVIFLLLFTRSILEVKKYFPKINKIFTILILFYFALGLFSMTQNYNLASFILVKASTLTFLFLLFIAFKSYISGNKIAIFYLVALTLFLGTMALFTLMAGGSIEYTLITRHFYILGSSVEVIILSIALAYKIKTLQNEKFILIDKSKKELEDKIKERTRELEDENRKFESILDTTMETVAIFENNMCVRVNDSALKMFGYETKEEIIGASPLIFPAKSSIEFATKKIKDDYSKSYEMLMQKKDGTEFVGLIKGLSSDENGVHRRMVSVMDLSEIKEKEHSLEIAKEKAEENNKQKSEFLANMSHEIRTPMNGIIGMTKLMEKTILGDTQKHYIEIINSSANSLLNVINDILDFSKIEAKKLEIDKVDFNLENLLTNVKNITEYKAEEKGLIFEIIYDKSVVNLNGDSLRISQILINLLNNAIKFTETGFVKLIISHANNDFTFEIKDSGVGIAKNQQEQLFNSFTQADASTTRKHGGTGLGLSISKELVELMGGRIVLDSQEEVGSSFSFTLDLQPSFSKIEGEVNKTKTVEELFELNGSNILLVEDNLINQEIVIGLLKGSGVDISIANNGVEAIDMLKLNKDSYELILMDLQMPVMGGIEATKVIRELGFNIPIVALTANAMKEDAQKTKNAGMNEHLNKPIDVNELYDVLLKYISKKSDKSEMVVDRYVDVEVPEFVKIDTQKALKLLGKNKNLYLKILKDFYQNYKDIKFEIFNESELKIATHTLKGLSTNIGAMDLYLSVKEFDESQDKIHMPRVYEELKIVIDELASIDERVKSTKELKKEVSYDKIERLFMELREKVKTSRPKECQMIIEKLNGYKLNPKDDELLESVTRLIKVYKFKEVLEILRGT